MNRQNDIALSMRNNNGFYQNSYYQEPRFAITGINWCQGDAGAKAWYVAPGTGAVLLDSEDNVMYIKYADQMGRPTLLKKCYEDFVDEAPLALPQNSSAPAPSMDMSEYIRREEVEDMITREVEKRMNDMQQSKTGRGRGGSTNA